MLRDIKFRICIRVLDGFGYGYRYKIISDNISYGYYIFQRIVCRNKIGIIWTVIGDLYYFSFDNYMYFKEFLVLLKLFEVFKYIILFRISDNYGYGYEIL